MVSSLELLRQQLDLAKIARQFSKPLNGFKDNIFMLDTPIPDAVSPTASIAPEQSAEEDDEDEQIPVGLHAKIFAVRKGKNCGYGLVARTRPNGHGAVKTSR